MAEGVQLDPRNKGANRLVLSAPFSTKALEDQGKQEANEHCHPCRYLHLVSQGSALRHQEQHLPQRNIRESSQSNDHLPHSKRTSSGQWPE